MNLFDINSASGVSAFLFGLLLKLTNADLSVVIRAVFFTSTFLGFSI